MVCFSFSRFDGCGEGGVIEEFELMMRIGTSRNSPPETSFLTALRNVKIE